MLENEHSELRGKSYKHLHWVECTWWSLTTTPSASAPTSKASAVLLLLIHLFRLGDLDLALTGGQTL